MMGTEPLLERDPFALEKKSGTSTDSTTSSGGDYSSNKDPSPSSDSQSSADSKSSLNNKATSTNESQPTTPSIKTDPDNHIYLQDVGSCLKTCNAKALDPVQIQNLTNGDTTTNAQQDPTTFRVIIVGGGPNGLCLAHALHLADIDYVLLERGGEIINQDGASIALWPHSVRILDQLGLLDEARKHYFPVRTKHNHRADGSVRDVNDMFAKMEENHGHPWMLFHRAKLLELLWESLPGKETKVKVNKKVVSVASNRNGVVVTCADGTSESGSIVIGCDGVHSTVRQAIRKLRSEKKRAGSKLSLASLASSLSSNSDSGEDRPMKTYYYGLIGWIPLPDGLQPAACYEVRSEPKGKTFHILTGVDTAYFLVYVHLDKPTRERSRYTDEDAEKLAAELAGHKITSDITFGDLWQSRKWGKMLDFEEGILGSKWYHERVVLVGDAVHKLTPNVGLGLNSGWQGVAELTNRLRKLVATRGQEPDTQSVKKVFKEYQNSRKGMAKTTMLVSSTYTRVVANQSLWYRFCDWVTPAIGGDIAVLNNVASPIVKRSVTLDFVAEKRHKEGKVRWAHPQYVPAEDCDSEYRKT
ncbi:hypothetical protein VPNG_02531 [Cytospora leucostoma]|uniref:FAD-binding domain-containing protein n=1 Tax=Cytospora leucostoma TaxID=1230097 RepID=A0A423XI14_9PEZI|nr:hypothetical protein VPNG_02531 [Cytospora leucostoma]